MSVSVATPTIDHHRVPRGIGNPEPRVSWIVDEAPSGWVQQSAEIEITVDDNVSVYRHEGSDSVRVAWPFAPLVSRQRAVVRVRVTGSESAEPSAWSAGVAVEAGLFAVGDWTAVAVGPSWEEDPEQMRRPALLRTGFEVRGAVASARLYITADGVYQAEINGARVGNDELAPGWTSYPSRLRYYTYDVAEHLSEGPNALGAWLGDGWYRGRLGFHGGHVNLYGNQTALLAQLVIEYRDGAIETVTTGRDWVCAPAPILTAGLLEGEHYDARLEQSGWSAPGFDASEWQKVAPRAFDLRRLVAPEGPSVTCVEEVTPVAVDRRPDGRTIVDFGQNLVGRVRLDTSGRAGTTVTLRHAEVLDRDGELITRPLRGAHSTDRYVLRGGGQETWEPRFTIHGFRYVEISGIEDEPARADVVARVLHTDMRRTGWFNCSDPDLNRLHENVLWSMKGNFVDLPTDCPQRDERLGWTGDIQVFAPTATFLFDCAGLLSSWLQDVAAEQHPDGTVPWYVPVIPGGEQWTPARPGAGWGDAAALVPWSIYRVFDDVDVLRRQYPSARSWNDLQDRLAGDDHVWDGSYQLGDWLDPSAPPEDPAHGSTDPDLVASAYYARTTSILQRTSERLGGADVVMLTERARDARDGFRNRYLRSAGTLASDSQAAYALAIVFDLLDEEELPIAGNHLARLVRDAGVHLNTGFLGTPVLLDALTLTGHADLAFALLQQRTVPSWLYPVTMGATTIWERWDSLLPNGDVNPGDMTSFNHFAFGAVADWMHRTIGGLEITSAGGRTLRFRPGVQSGLTHASAAHLTSYGLASIDWEREGGCLRVRVKVPVGATAILDLPGHSHRQLSSGLHTAEVVF